MPMRNGRQKGLCPGAPQGPAWHHADQSNTCDKLLTLLACLSQEMRNRRCLLGEEFFLGSASLELLVPKVAGIESIQSSNGS